MAPHIRYGLRLAIAGFLASSCAHRSAPTATPRAAPALEPIVVECLGEIRPVQVARSDMQAEDAISALPKAERRSVDAAVEGRVDPAERISALEKAFRKFKPRPVAREYVRSRLIDAYREIDDVKSIARMVDEWPIDDTEETSAWHASAAAEYIDHGVLLDEARVFLARAFAFLLGEELDGPESSEPEFVWRRKISAARARLMRDLGRLEGKTGRVDRAERIFDRIFATDDTWLAHRVFGEILESVDAARAVEEYSRALALNRDEDPATIAALQRLRGQEESFAILKDVRRIGAQTRQRALLGARLSAAPPEFSTATLDGKPLTQKHVRATPVLLVSFFSTSCGPCLAEQPVLGRLKANFGGRVRVIVIGIDDEDDFRSHVASKGVDGVEYAYSPTMSRAFGVRGIPDTIVFGAEGRIEFRNLGFGAKTEGILEDQIGALLSLRRP